MKIFKHIWNLFFGSKKKYTDSKGVTIPEIENQEPRTFSVSVVISIWGVLRFRLDRTSRIIGCRTSDTSLDFSISEYFKKIH